MRRADAKHSIHTQNTGLYRRVRVYTPFLHDYPALRGEIRGCNVTLPRWQTRAIIGFDPTVDANSTVC